jgi:TolA-binding protein
MKGAITDLSRFMAMNPSDQEALEASYFLGVAYSLSKRYEESVPPLARFVAQDKKAKSRDHAMYLLVHSYEQTGQLDKAAETAREALMTYPSSGFASQLRARLTSARRALGAEAASGTASAGRNSGEEARAPAKPSAASTGR